MIQRIAGKRRPFQKVLAISVLFPLIAASFAKTLAQEPKNSCQKAKSSPNFVIMAGGGAPSYNEIALEKNVLYFQRTLRFMGFEPTSASTYFANGNDGQATIRYLDKDGNEQFKVPQIPHLSGAATLNNFVAWLQKTVNRADKRSIFFYFTGHGTHNRKDENNNAMILWNEQTLSVQKFASLLDQMPSDIPIVTMMAQCFSGSFANFIYEKGDPKQAVALQTRCGFFATVKSLPSVGCTPEVNEADYRDYSSSFFAGLSGRDRTGKAVASADYNQDGTVSYSEAHAFAKVDEQTQDVPVSTLEVWLQEQPTPGTSEKILTQPIADWVKTARPEQQYVIRSLAKRLRFSLDRSYLENSQDLDKASLDTVEEAYLIRLGLELINVGMEQQVRQQKNPKAIAIIDRLIKCEGGSWKSL